MTDIQIMDVAGSLYTNTYRNTKIRGKVPAATNLEGTGSCFDLSTTSLARAGAHKPLEVNAKELPRWSRATLTYTHASAKPSPSEYLHKGDGGIIKASRPSTARSVSPPRAGAFERRDNPPNTAFRRFYERGDLPICVDHKSFKNAIKWRVDLDMVDYHHYLPIFLDGIRETQEPYRFLAVKGVEDLLKAGGPRILPVIPQLIIPMKTALNTRDPAVVAIALQLLQKLVCSADLVGEALVPYYRQLLPILNLYKNCNKNLGDGIDYNQQNNECLGDLISETLSIMEARGGPDAYINIKYMVPTYESAIAFS